ncbi:MAG: amidohydrolase family protein [Clostridiales bacterium]|nr:amidohydrolase family protein [Clostridiales bacterium]
MIILKNGHVVDPLNHINEVTDVLVDGNRILGVGDARRFLCGGDGKAVSLAHTIDAGGCYVVPGLIDHHCHMYPLANIGLPAEAVCFASGVTTAVDAGSAGCATYAMYRPFIQLSKLTIRAYLNVCTTGLASLPKSLECVDPATWDEGAIRDCFERYPGELLGLKLRTSHPIVKELGYEPLRATVRLAERLGVSVMVHCTNPPGELSELLDLLRPGDVLTHMYMNQGSCLVENGAVIEAAKRARQRGVLFEAADARAHFGLPVAEIAIEEEFLPDILATDLTKLSMHLRPTSFNLAMQISKYHELGISFTKLIECCTVAPARQMGMLDVAGSLTPGHAADIAVLRPVEQTYRFGDRVDGDPNQHTREGHLVYQPVLTVKNGEMVYRDVTF